MLARPVVNTGLSQVVTAGPKMPVSISRHVTSRAIFVNRSKRRRTPSLGAQCAGGFRIDVARGLEDSVSKDCAGYRGSSNQVESQIKQSEV